MTLEDILNGIDDEQKKEAILTYQNDGRYLIIAGPGTGKTYTVSKRIGAIISDTEKGTSADRILCLTFSDAAAREMQRGLEKNKVHYAESVNIYTFHSFCMNIIQEYQELFELEKINLISSVQQQATVKECLDELEQNEETKIKYLRSNSSLYSNIDSIVKGIKEIKNKRLTAEQCEKNMDINPIWQNDEKKKNETRELLRIFEKYKKKTENFIDFDDMINKVLDKFESNPEFLEEISSKYDFVLVDEYQDTNKSQNDIVFKLAEHCKNTFVVGDDDQIIYTFQGASLDTIDNFINKLQVSKVIPLRNNFRSTNTILRVSEELAKIQDEYVDFYIDKRINGCQSKEQSDTGKESKRVKYIKCHYAAKSFPLRLFSKPEFIEQYKKNNDNFSKSLISSNDKLKGKDTPVKLIEYQNQDTEKAFTVRKVLDISKKLEEEKTPLSEIAILVNTNNEVEEYYTLLKENGIRAQIVKGKNILKANSVKTLIAYMQFLSNADLYSDKIITFLISKPFHINPNDLNIIMKTTGNNLIEKIKKAIKVSQEERQKNDDEKNKYKILKQQTRLENFINTYEELYKFKDAETISNTINQIVYRTGIFNCYTRIEINRTENYDAIRKFVEEAKNYSDNDKLANFNNFVDYINTLISGNIEILPDKTDKPLNAVQVSTLHSSKGREFEYVFMPNLVKNKYESSDKQTERVPLDWNINDITAVEDEVYDKQDDKKRVEDKKWQIHFLNNLKLLYVGMTRAKHTLVLSYSIGDISWYIERLKNKLEHKEDLFVFCQNNETVSEANLRDISYENELKEDINTIKNFADYIEGEEHKKEFEAALNKINKFVELLKITATPDEASAVDYNYKEEWKEYTNNNYQEKYSPSALNCYKNCPKQYYYKYILKIPPKIKLKNSFDSEIGNAIHYALENMVKNAVKNRKKGIFEYPSKDSFISDFKTHIEENAPGLDNSTIEDKIKSLEDCYDKFINDIDINNLYEQEYKIDNFCLHNDEVGKIYFEGKIDRLDKIEKPDTSSNSKDSYIIYDYKTGKLKEAKDVCFNGKYEDIYYQLGFYKYLLNHNSQKDCEVKEVWVIFPEDYDQSYQITNLDDESCNKIKDDYMNIIKNIKNHEFDKPDKPNCFFCDFKSQCYSKIL